MKSIFLFAGVLSYGLAEASTLYKVESGNFADCDATRFTENVSFQDFDENVADFAFSVLTASEHRAVFIKSCQDFIREANGFYESNEALSSFWETIGQEREGLDCHPKIAFLQAVLNALKDMKGTDDLFLYFTDSLLLRVSDVVELQFFLNIAGFVNPFLAENPQEIPYIFMLSEIIYKKVGSQNLQFAQQIFGDCFDFVLTKDPSFWEWISTMMRRTLPYVENPKQIPSVFEFVQSLLGRGDLLPFFSFVPSAIENVAKEINDLQEALTFVSALLNNNQSVLIKTEEKIQFPDSSCLLALILLSKGIGLQSSKKRPLSISFLFQELAIRIEDMNDPVFFAFIQSVVNGLISFFLDKNDQFESEELLSAVSSLLCDALFPEDFENKELEEQAREILKNLELEKRGKEFEEGDQIVSDFLTDLFNEDPETKAQRPQIPLSIYAPLADVIEYISANSDNYPQSISDLIDFYEIFTTTSFGEKVFLVSILPAYLRYSHHILSKGIQDS